MVLFVFGSLVSSFLGSGNSGIFFVGGFIVFVSVCRSVSGIWLVDAGCVDTVGILCAWVCKLGFQCLGIGLLHAFSLAGKACLFLCRGEYCICVVFDCDCEGVWDKFGVFWVYVYLSPKT